MAYDTAKLTTAVPRMSVGGNAIHTYESPDAIATVIAAGYISDGNAKGIKVNDIVHCIRTGTPTLNTCLVTVVSAAGLVTMIKAVVT